MAQHETREIASYLRDGSLWVGHFVISNGELNFGDDRFDAAHGLANLVAVELMRSTKEADGQMQAWSRSAKQTVGGKITSAPQVCTVAERVRWAA